MEELMKRIRVQRPVVMAAVAAFAAATLVPSAPAHAQDKPQKVVLRFAADFTPPPHPAGIAMKHFQERLPQVIPGSEARVYFAGALYTIPEAFEAMRQGNLEMAWMQIGRSEEHTSELQSQSNLVC